MNCHPGCHRTRGQEEAGSAACGTPGMWATVRGAGCQTLREGRRWVAEGVAETRAGAAGCLVAEVDCRGHGQGSGVLPRAGTELDRGGRRPDHRPAENSRPWAWPRPTQGVSDTGKRRGREGLAPLHPGHGLEP